MTDEKLPSKNKNIIRGKSKPLSSVINITLKLGYL